MRKVTLLYTLQISLMSALTEGSYILISTSVFNLLQYVALVEVYEENAHTDVLLQKKEVF